MHMYRDATAEKDPDIGAVFRLAKCNAAVSFSCGILTDRSLIDGSLLSSHGAAYRLSFPPFFSFLFPRFSVLPGAGAKTRVEHPPAFIRGFIIACPANGAR